MTVLDAQLTGPPAGADADHLFAGGPWVVAYPRRCGTWAAAGRDENGARIYGVYDPATRASRLVRPEDDRQLPALAAWAARGELLAYRVGRRAVVRLRHPEGDVRYAKILRPARLEPLLRRLHVVEQAAGRAAEEFPQLAPVRAVATDGAVVFGHLSGTALHDLVMTEAAPAVDRALVDVARSLAAFHRTPADGLDLPRVDPGPPPAEWAELVARHDPGLRSRYEAVLPKLPERPVPSTSGRPRLVHGDLHDRNVLLGRRVGLLDLDGLRLGDPVEDVGNLAAHLVLRSLQRNAPADEGRRQAAVLFEAYRRAGGCIEGDEAVDVGAVTLFRLACLYRFRRRWTGLVAALLDESQHWASGHVR